MTETFADYFSVTAPDYERFRPRYPETLFDLITSLVVQRERAWDCATGSGQAIGPLVKCFGHVLASDASSAQIRHATVAPQVELFLARAERVPLRDACIDLITVAQALHWFDLDAFVAEAERVLKPGGILAAWTYNLCRVNAVIDGVVRSFYRDIIGPYWPSERRLVDEAYASITLSLSDSRSMSTSMSAQWTLDHLMHYFGTWSAVLAYRKTHGSDPVELISSDLHRAWGDVETRRVTWPITLKTARR